MRHLFLAVLAMVSIQAQAQVEEKTDLLVTCKPVGEEGAAGGLNRATISGVLMLDADSSVVGHLTMALRGLGKKAQPVQVPAFSVTGQLESRDLAVAHGGLVRTIVIRASGIQSDRKISLLRLSDLKTMSPQSSVVVDGVMYLTNCRFE